MEHNGEALGPFTLGDLKELVLAGGLTVERSLRQQGGVWGPASSYAEVLALFPAPAPQTTEVPSEAAGGLGDARHCYAHPGAVPGYACAQCLRYLCGDCVRVSAVQAGAKPLRLCAACGGLATALVRRAEWTPFYSDLAQVFSSPLRGHALFYFLVLFFAEILKTPARFGGLLGLLAVGILTTFQMSFYLHVIREVGQGSYQVPEWPEMTDVFGMVGSVFKVLIVTLVALVPAILVSMVLGAGSVLSLLAAAGGREGGAAAAAGGLFLTVLVFGAFSLIYAFYLPISITIVAVFNTVLPALNPVLIVRIILRIGIPYVAAVALIITMTIMQVALGLFVRSAPIAGAFGIALFGVYVNMVTCYIMGRVVYENEERIGWTV
jgi:hypothetical protein